MRLVEAKAVEGVGNVKDGKVQERGISWARILPADAAKRERNPKEGASHREVWGGLRTGGL